MKRFRPGVVPTVAVVLLLPLMVSLGVWQLGRGAEKTALLASYAERRAAEPMAAAELLHSADPAFRRVHLHGRFDADHSLLLDNRQRDGKVGVELLQPFQDRRTGQWLLVNRGWLPWPDRRLAPQFTTPADAVDMDAWVYVAPGATFQLHADPVSDAWPQTVTAVEPARLWKTLDRDGFAYEVRAEPGPASYVTDWPVVAMGPEKHLGYAVQWFAMATALLGLYLYLGWHNAKEKHHGSGHESTQHV
ncbi:MULTISPECIES: SURF1 family protein [unclassified Pseudomonas]|uniref:SURF1 family protein n=1 Tax=unclassified Pseudomonas TaxID=196821 RepID=UPI000A1E47DB|nr:MULTISPECIES: SURF1 family protein [unclassified Pseudomonas]